MTELTSEQRLVAMRKALGLDPLENYIRLPAKIHGSYSYTDLLVSKNTFHQDKYWEDAQTALKQEHLQMLTIRQFVDFLNLLKSGIAYDGAGHQIEKQELTELFNDITEVRRPLRGEWLDAYFEKKNGELYLLTQNMTKAEKLEACLMEDRGVDDKPGIDLDDWLANANPQGLPNPKVESGKLSYDFPRSGNVAYFIANPKHAYLRCLMAEPDNGRDPWLRVRKVAPLGVALK